MLSNLRRIVVGLTLALLALSLRPSAGLFQSKRVEAADGAQAGAVKQSGQKPPASAGETSAEEKLVRDVYARLMRYQSAAADELAAERSKETTPEEYLTFELRAIHSGPISEIYDRPLDEVATPGGGQVVSVKPTRLGGGDGVAHTYYEAQWTTAAGAVEKSGPSRAKGAGAQTIGQWLQRGSGKQSAAVTRYTSYEVTAQLQGQRRSYRALVLYRLKDSQPLSAYRTEGERQSKLAGIEVVDNVTAGMGAVLTDESPQVRVPWAKYSKSSLYLAVQREIREAKEAGKPLIPADAPIGYLPGDNAAPNKRDFQTLAAKAVCPGLRILRDGNQDITDTTQNVVIGERINLSLEVTPEGSEPSDIQWTVGGSRVAGYTPSTGATAAPTALTNLSSPDLTFYWIAPGQEIEVSVTATTFGTPVTRSAHFNVAAPSDTTPSVTLPTGGHLNINNLIDCSSSNLSAAPNLVFGNLSGPNCSTGAYSGQAGIIFSPPVVGPTTTPPGNFFFVQLITSDSVTYIHTDGSPLTCSATSGLDGNYPYEGRTGRPVEDAPTTPLPSIYTTASRDFAATMYLMWQSNTTGSIPVPMGSINWTISGSTTQSNGVWGTPTGSGSPQAFAPASGIGSFPTWPGRAVPNATCH